MDVNKIKSQLNNKYIVAGLLIMLFAVVSIVFIGTTLDINSDSPINNSDPPVEEKPIDEDNPIDQTYNKSPDCSNVSYNNSASGLEVTNVYELQCIGASDNSLSNSYVIKNNINASSTDNWNDGKGFKPIGSEYNYLSGSIDGNGYNITGLYIDRPNRDYTGLIGRLGYDSFEQTTISDLSIVDADIKGSDHTGVLIGHNKGVVRDVSVSGDIIGDGHVGGLIGSNDGTGATTGQNGRVVKSNSDVIINADHTTGGLIGENSYGYISKTHSDGEVDGDLNAGGLIETNTGDVVHSYSQADVNGEYDGVSYGGLVASNEGSVEKSYASGEVNADTDFTGGLIGSNYGTVKNSYWNKLSTGQQSSEGGTGLRTSDMIGDNAPDNMDGFDFNSIWITVEGDHPELR